MDRHVQWLRRRIFASVATQTTEVFTVVAILAFAFLYWRTDESPLSSLFAALFIGQVVAMGRLVHAVWSNPLNYRFMRKFIDSPFSYSVSRFQEEEDVDVSCGLPGFSPVATIRDDDADPSPIFDVFQDPSRLVAVTVSRASGASALISSLADGRLLVTDGRVLPPHERLVMNIAADASMSSLTSAHQRAISGRFDVVALPSGAHHAVLDSLRLEHESYSALGPMMSAFFDVEPQTRSWLRLTARVRGSELAALPARLGLDHMTADRTTASASAETPAAEVSAPAPLGSSVPEVVAPTVSAPAPPAVPEVVAPTVSAPAPPAVREVVAPTVSAQTTPVPASSQPVPTEPVPVAAAPAAEPVPVVAAPVVAASVAAEPAEPVPVVAASVAAEPVPVVAAPVVAASVVEPGGAHVAQPPFVVGAEHISDHEPAMQYESVSYLLSAPAASPSSVSAALSGRDPSPVDEVAATSPTTVVAHDDQVVSTNEEVFIPVIAPPRAQRAALAEAGYVFPDLENVDTGGTEPITTEVPIVTIHAVAEEPTVFDQPATVVDEVASIPVETAVVAELTPVAEPAVCTTARRAASPAAFSLVPDLAPVGPREPAPVDVPPTVDAAARDAVVPADVPVSEPVVSPLLAAAVAPAVVQTPIVTAASTHEAVPSHVALPLPAVAEAARVEAARVEAARVEAARVQAALPASAAEAAGSDPWFIDHNVVTGGAPRAAQPAYATAGSFASHVAAEAPAHGDVATTPVSPPHPSFEESTHSRPRLSVALRGPQSGARTARTKTRRKFL